MNDKWIPEVGRLVVRQELGHNCNCMQLCYRDEPDHASRTRSMANADDFEARPQWGGWTEGVAGELEVIDGQRMILRRLATDNDIRMFLALWSDKHVTLAEWLVEVQELPALLDEEKERIMRLAAKVQNRR